MRINKIVIYFLIYFLRLLLGSLLLATLFLSGCAPGEMPEDNNFTKKNVTLTLSNHKKGGYGSNQCFSCHQEENIHTKNTLGLDLKNARNMANKYKESRCWVCHGSNGVL